MPRPRREPSSPYARKQTSFPSRRISPRPAGISRRVSSSGTPSPRPRGYRIAQGRPDPMAVKSRCCSSFSSFGAATVRFGMQRVYVMSNTPWWVLPSSPTSPARSMHDGDRQRLDRHVVDQLVERALKEGRVDRDHRLPAFLGHSRRHDDRVLFCDAHVVDAIGKMLADLGESGALEHRRADRDDLRVFRHHRDQRLREDLRIGVPRSRTRRTATGSRAGGTSAGCLRRACTRVPCASARGGRRASRRGRSP